MITPCSAACWSPLADRLIVLIEPDGMVLALHAPLLWLTFAGASTRWCPEVLMIAALRRRASNCRLPVPAPHSLAIASNRRRPWRSSLPGRAITWRRMLAFLVTAEDEIAGCVHAMSTSAPKLP